MERRCGRPREHPGAAAGSDGSIRTKLGVLLSTSSEGVSTPAICDSTKTRNAHSASSFFPHAKQCSPYSISPADAVGNAASILVI